ncbi:PRD domain-containing protein [Alkaliphilus peptidifermentans]|uniref:PRD domain protein EF_0829/AHA_3910 n=1 Tax=Alkaliphilus peptidifermentans DSM 18978 TaxID=1120976 RepID=A0A1G5ISV3_9FIRM|nr:PRD domain-containing protein [Alkaliphilus peptidifermentans]SCY79057.1 PRD domain protein EF_0829/AHA_3910 [Alkaliphilus peptidifermentans DSM 18978]
MEVLEILKNRLEIEAEELEEIISEITRIEKNLGQENILLDEQAKVGLYSHMISFIRRLKNNEQVMGIGEEIASQIDKKPIRLAEEIAHPLFERYKVLIDLSEILLIAIHIQAAISDDEENNAEYQTMKGGM